MTLKAKTFGDIRREIFLRYNPEFPRPARIEDASSETGADELIERLKEDGTIIEYVKDNPRLSYTHPTSGLTIFRINYEMVETFAFLKYYEQYWHVKGDIQILGVIPSRGNVGYYIGYFLGYFCFQLVAFRNYVQTFLTTSFSIAEKKILKKNGPIENWKNIRNINPILRKISEKLSSESIVKIKNYRDSYAHVEFPRFDGESLPWDWIPKAKREDELQFDRSYRRNIILVEDALEICKEIFLDINGIYKSRVPLLVK